MFDLRRLTVGVLVLVLGGWLSWLVLWVGWWWVCVAGWRGRARSACC